MSKVGRDGYGGNSASTNATLKSSRSSCSGNLSLALGWLIHGLPIQFQVIYRGKLTATSSQL